MECLKRTVVEVKDTKIYQSAFLDDPTLKVGDPAYWCIP
jgi:hypothetical protein